jgi:hypothetical protein
LFLPTVGRVLVPFFIVHIAREERVLLLNPNEEDLVDTNMEELAGTCAPLKGQQLEPFWSVFVEETHLVS